MPNEAEGHHELAKVRHQEKNWDLAILHWMRVAELRELEPTGLIGKIRSELAADRRGEAEQSFAKLNEKKWPNRFRGELDKVRKEMGVK